jgi:hypothetical protein
VAEEGGGQRLGPATVIASRLSITPAKRASAGMTLSEVTSRPPPGSLAQILSQGGADESGNVGAGREP